MQRVYTFSRGVHACEEGFGFRKVFGVIGKVAVSRACLSFRVGQDEGYFIDKVVGGNRLAVLVAGNKCLEGLHKLVLGSAIVNEVWIEVIAQFAGYLRWIAAVW